MKAVAVIGGLGSQMFKYAFFLALKEKCNDECVIDTSFFMQRKSWNGYELEKIFGIKERDLQDLLSKDQRDSITSKKKSYIDVCLSFLNRDHNVNYFFMGTKYNYGRFPIPAYRIIRQKVLFLLNNMGKHFSYSLDEVCGEGNAYFDEYPHNSDEHFREYKDTIKDTFAFPQFTDEKNSLVSTKMSGQTSVAIHIRRTDHLGDNGKLFEREYYKKAVEYIKKKENGVLFYYIFSEDLDWCKNNLSSLGIGSNEDVTFVDWNNGENSYRDLQLMMYCKHNILAISSFSWWGYYLSNRTDKIVCAPIGYWTEVENHF